jgi:flagellin
MSLFSGLSGADWNVIAGLNNVDSALWRSNTQLSTGVQVALPGDNPTQFSHMNGMQAQIAEYSSLQSSLQSSSSLLSTVKNSLAEVSSQLSAIQSAVTDATNNPGDAAADQTTISNAIAAINGVAQNTTFNGRTLLNGSASSGANIGGNADFANIQINTTQGSGILKSGNVTLTVNTAATAATVDGFGATYASVNSQVSTVNGGTSGAGGTVKINGVAVSVAGSDTVQTLINNVNAVSGQTGVVASFVSMGSYSYIALQQQTLGSSYSITEQETSPLITGGTQVTPLYSSVNASLGSAPTNAAPSLISNLALGSSFGGTDLKAGSVTMTVTTAAAVAAVSGAGNATYASTSSTLTNGSIVLNGTTINTTNGETVAAFITAINGNTGTTGVTATFASGQIQLSQTTTGSQYGITLTDAGHRIVKSGSASVTGVNAVVSVTATAGSGTSVSQVTENFTGGANAGNSGLVLSDGHGNSFTLSASANSTSTVNQTIANVSGASLNVNGTTLGFSGAETVQQLINQVNATTGTTGVTAAWVTSGSNGYVQLKQGGNPLAIDSSDSDDLVAYQNPSTVYGTNAQVTATVQTISPTGPGLATLTLTGGGTVGSQNITVSDSNGDQIVITPAGNTTSVSNQSQGTTTGPLIFQSGKTLAQESYISLPSVYASALGTAAVAGQSLATIDVTTTQGATSAAAVVSYAMQSVATLQAQVAGFQKNILNSVAGFSGSQVSNYTPSVSAIRNTNTTQQSAINTNLLTQQQYAYTALYTLDQQPSYYLSLLT